MITLRLLEKHSISICLGLAAVTVIFIIIGHIFRDQVQSALKREFVHLPATTIDWWSVSHFGLYAIFGFLIPMYPMTFFAIGCLFEVFEDMLASKRTTQLKKCNTPRTDEHVLCRFSRDDDYWYAKWDDIFMNLLGYSVGSSIRTTFF